MTANYHNDLIEKALITSFKDLTPGQLWLLQNEVGLLRWSCKGWKKEMDKMKNLVLLKSQR